MSKILKLLFFLTVSSASAQPIHIANYNIEARLDTETKLIEGKQTLTWTNTSSYPARTLQFHLYLNAFKDFNSTFMRESGGYLRSDKADFNEEMDFGNIKINRIVLNSHRDIGKKGRFIQPDDDNLSDETVIEYDLTHPILAGETINIEIDFTSKLPKVFARTGWASNDYFMVGQWFPKIGVFEENGIWNCHQFHANTEFYSNFGIYKVGITLPQNLIVAGTGQKISETHLKSGQKRVYFEAERVHDFAWSASPDFRVLEETYKGVLLTAFMQPENKILKNRYFQPVKNAIDFMENKVGKYPHKTLSMIDPPYDAPGSLGMEYPTLITCGAWWGVGKPFKFQELVTIHEFVHQYFQGILASNEFEDSWLDEGFTQYLEGRIFDEYYKEGAVIDFLGIRVNEAATSRWDYVTMRYPELAPIRMNAWEYPRGTYATLTYTKPATVLKTMENLIGTDLMDEILRNYFEKYKFKHPKPEDFFETANKMVSEKSGFKDLDWFFEAAILKSRTCDYEISDLKSDSGKSSFKLRNKGKLNIPVKVKVIFKDRKTQIFDWNGDTRKWEFPKEILSVEIDPEHLNWLDLNLANNSKTLGNNKKWSLSFISKVLFAIQNALLLT